MSDMGDDYKAWREAKKEYRRKFGVECPQCPENRNPTILLPQQRCRVCGYIDPRSRQDEIDARKDD